MLKSRLCGKVAEKGGWVCYLSSSVRGFTVCFSVYCRERMANTVTVVQKKKKVEKPHLCASGTQKFQRTSSGLSGSISNGILFLGEKEKLLCSFIF